MIKKILVNLVFVFVFPIFGMQPEKKNFEQYKLNHELGFPTSETDSICVSSDNSFIVICNDLNLYVFYLESQKYKHLGKANCVAISDDNKHIYALAVNGKIQKINLETEESLDLADLKIENSYCLPSASSDQKIFVFGTDSGTLIIFNMDTKKRLDLACWHSEKITCVAISCNSKFVVTGSFDKLIKILDINSGKCLKVLKENTGGVISLTVANDSKFIVAGFDDKKIKLWDVEFGKCIRDCSEDCETNLVVISKDNKMIFTLHDKKLIVRDSQLNILKQFNHQGSEKLITFTISNDYTYLCVSFGKNITIFKKYKLIYIEPKRSSDTDVSKEESSNKKQKIATNECLFCDKPAHSRCTKCKVAYYCNERCQRQDWLRHKEVCESWDMMN